MRSHRSLEGYLLIDHRGGCGMDGQQGFLFESATVTCSHCQRQVVLNPDRSRSRGYCPKCDHYLCDQCEAARAASGGECFTFNQMADQALEAAEKALRRGAFIYG